MLLDLALAACCLLLLLAALVGALEIWSALSPATAPLDWRAFWASIHADPKQGITLYLMAATTLVPTLVHLIAGLGAVWTQKSRLLHPVAAKLAAQPVTKPFAEIEIDQMLRTIGRATLWGYARASVAVILPTAILLWIAYSLII
ncbi:hypothetical protein EGN72_04220 [Pseudorhodobacter sp. E13]|nr:hypothetical protein EGN72_04220 [Pseudorhodobacter sp. E13]